MCPKLYWTSAKKLCPALRRGKNNGKKMFELNFPADYFGDFPDLTHQFSKLFWQQCLRSV